ncbi:MAG: efflux RND transporter periplasmic adaptor subunit [Myxococcota bacterium]
MRAGRGLAALLTLGLACGGEAPTAPTDVDPEPLALAVVRVEGTSVAEPILGTGTIAAEKTTDIGPRVNGIIDQIYVRVGDRVQAGDPLFRTRTIDYELRVQAAQHALELARADLHKARRDRDRVRALHERAVASQDQLDAVETRYAVAAAQLGQAQTALARARQELEDTLVRAPYDATVTRRFVDEGAMETTMMSSSSRVVRVMKTDLVVAIVQVPSVHLPRIHIGTPAQVDIDGIEGARDSLVAVLNDAVDPRTRAFEVRLPLPNPDLAIKPGLFARAHLLPEPRTALVVPRRAVLGTEGVHYVYVPVDGRAKRREVQVRDLDAARMEVLEGLEAGARVLAGPNLPRVREGRRVALEVARANR